MRVRIITSININTSLSLYPTIQMSLEDIKGRAMFESGQNSPYAAFFNFPYPKFYLTIKGYYGKATRLPLMLQTFTSRYDTGDGNFKIDLKYFTIEFDLLLHERIIDYSIIHEELKKLTKRYNTLNLKYNKLLNNENIYTIYLFGQKLVNGCYINGLFFNSFNITKKHTRIY